MKIEIDLNELTMTARHPMAKGLIVAAVQKELNEIVQKHREALRQDAEKFLSSFLVRMHQEWDRGVTKILITDDKETE